MPTDLVLPIVEYATDPSPELAAAYVEIAPWFEECYCPVNPASVTLGHQLFWLSREFPEAFARARWILPFAQYWAWGLSGVAACEVTSLGAQTQLWNPRERAFSSLVEQQGWADKFPPLRNAWEVLGPLQFEIAKKCHLPADIPVLCGIYASGANMARYLAAGLDDFTLISTGEWLVVYQPHLPLAQLEPLRDTAANVDLLGRPVACARFMAGREYAAIAGAEAGCRAEVADVEALVAAGTMALPSFTRSGGPFPGDERQGADRGRAAQLRARGCAGQPVSGADGQRVPGSPALTRPGDHRRRVCRRPAVHGTARCAPARAVGRGVARRQGAALGAALLWGWSERTAPAPLDLRPVVAPRIAGLAPTSAAGGRPRRRRGILTRLDPASGVPTRAKADGQQWTRSAPEPGDHSARPENGVGASARSRPSCLSSAQKSAGILGREDLDVLGDLRRRARARDHRRHHRVAERELQRRGRQAHAVPRAHRLDPAHPLHDLGRRRRILEIGALDRAGRKDAGVVGAADDQRDVAPLAQRQELVERRLLEQGVAAGEQESSRSRRAPRDPGSRRLVDPGADRPHRTLLAQLDHRPVAARHELLDPGAPRLLRAVGPDVEVVDQQDVDPPVCQGAAGCPRPSA